MSEVQCSMHYRSHGVMVNLRWEEIGASPAGAHFCFLHLALVPVPRTVRRASSTFGTTFRNIMFGSANLPEYGHLRESYRKRLTMLRLRKIEVMRARQWIQ